MIELNLSDQIGHIRDGDRLVVDLVDQYRHEIQRMDPLLNAFVLVDEDAAHSAGSEVDLRRARGAYRKLDGVVVAVKDNIAEEGRANPAGCRAYEQHIARGHAKILELILREGAIVIGRTNMAELSIGVTTDNPHYGSTKNPWDLSTTPGGSSGGSAVAVSGRMCSIALGTDTGGSVRLPAALTGTVGFKPTLGAIEMTGVRTRSWTLDHCGLITRSVSDCMMIIETLLATQRHSGRPICQKGHSTDPGEGGLAGLKVGYVGGPLVENISSEVADAFAFTLELLSSLGAGLEEVPFSGADECLNIHRAITQYETHAVHSDLLEEHEEIGEVARRELTEGSLVSKAVYEEALAKRVRFAWQLQSHMRALDVLISPATATQAIPTGVEAAFVGGRFQSARELYLKFTVPFSLSGNPAVELPVGLSRSGLPVGIQLVGALGGDMRLLAVASQLERHLGLNLRPPLPSR